MAAESPRVSDNQDMTPTKQTEAPIPELGNRTFAELEVIEDDSDHSLLFKDQIRRRQRDGTWKAEPVRVRIVRGKLLAMCRAKARAWFRDNGLDEDRDKDLFDDIEQAHILALAIRTPTPPHAQYADVEELLQDYDEASLQDVLSRISVYRQLLDPRESNLTEEDVWQKIAAVARREHLGPLADIAGHEQASCVIFMARMALQSPTGQSWLQSTETSTPDPSA